MAYNAIVCKVKTRPHPNADRLQLATVSGHQVVVGLNTKDGDMGLFFPTDGQLSKEFAEANDLLSRVDEKTGKRAGGFFCKNRRVRSQNFRMEKSEGFWCPLSYLDFTKGDTSTLNEGDILDSFNGVPLCNKYYTKATRTQMANNNSKVNKRETVMFKRHMETQQFKYFSRSIKEGAIAHLTEKVHGTSGRVGHVMESYIPDWVPNWTPNWFKEKFRKNEWSYLTGSRNVILEKSDGTGFYGTNQFRYDAAKDLYGNLHKGETVFFEIVGWANDSTPIMPSVHTKKLGDKEFTETYGEEMLYTYGQPQGTCTIYVYRITMTNEDGIETDLNWNAVKERCSELGVKHAPDICSAIVITEKNMDWFERFVGFTAKGKSMICPAHIKEGICIRIDNGRTPFILKEKSFEFGVLEGYIRDKDNYIDLEETA